jgi:type II secretory pathway component PulM
MEILAAGFFVVLAIWFFGIWRSYQERRRHPPRY